MMGGLLPKCLKSNQHEENSIFNFTGYVCCYYNRSPKETYKKKKKVSEANLQPAPVSIVPTVYGGIGAVERDLPSSETVQQYMDLMEESNPVKREQQLIALGVYATSDMYFAKELEKYKDSCSANKQIPIRVNHYTLTSTELKKNSGQILFIGHYKFDRQKYLDENAAIGKTTGMVIPCNFSTYIDLVSNSLVGILPYGMELCIQEKL